MIAGQARGATFGKVVSIGGAAADLVLDEGRGKLYIANFTANRIDVMSLATNTIQTSINVPAQPSSVALSPDGHWLLVGHYGNNTAPLSPQSGLTLIDLTNQNAKQTFALGNPPLGVAFGIDNKALVVTTTAFIVSIRQWEPPPRCRRFRPQPRRRSRCRRLTSRPTSSALP